MTDLTPRRSPPAWRRLALCLLATAPAWALLSTQAARAAQPDTFIITGPSGPTATDSPTFTFDAGGANAHFECALDVVVLTPCTSPISYDGLADGAHLFRVRAITDEFDATPAERTFVVDTVAPQTMYTSGPDLLTTATTANFTLLASEPGAFQCRLDDGAWKSCDAAPQYTSVASGSHTAAFAAIDEAGNVDPVPATYFWTADLTKPESWVTFEPAAPVTGPPHLGPHFVLDDDITIHFGASDAESAIASLVLDWGIPQVFEGGTLPEFSEVPGVGLPTLEGSVDVHVPMAGKLCTMAWSSDSVAHQGVAAPCVEVPYHGAILGRSGTWQQGWGFGPFLGSYVESSVAGSALKLTLGKAVYRVALVATVCPGCGKVEVTLHADGKRDMVKTVSLSARRFAARQAISVFEWVAAGASTARHVDKITLTVAGSGKPVRIEGLGVQRYKDTAQIYAY